MSRSWLTISWRLEQSLVVLLDQSFCTGKLHLLIPQYKSFRLGSPRGSGKTHTWGATPSAETPRETQNKVSKLANAGQSFQRCKCCRVQFCEDSNLGTDQRLSGTNNEVDSLPRPLHAACPSITPAAKRGSAEELPSNVKRREQDLFPTDAEGPPKHFPSFQPRLAHCTFHSSQSRCAPNREVFCTLTPTVIHASDTKSPR